MRAASQQVGPLPPIVLATLRTKMVDLAVEIAEGAVWANAARQGTLDDALLALGDPVVAMRGFDQQHREGKGRVVALIGEMASVGTGQEAEQCVEHGHSLSVVPLDRRLIISRTMSCGSSSKGGEDFLHCL
jgi:hypothetical protein